MKESRRSTDAAIVLSSRVGMLALTFGAGVVTARAFTPEARGEYGLFVTVASFVTVFSSLGLAEAIVYFENRGEADARRAITSAVLGVGIATVVTAVASAWLVPWLSTHYFPDSGSLVAALALASGVAVVLQQNVAAHLHAQRRFLQLSFVSIVRPAVFMVALLWVWWTNAGMKETAILFLFAAILGAAATVLPFARSIAPSSLDRGYARRLFGFGVKSYANAAVNQLNYRIDMLLVGYLLADLAQVAAYSIAASLAALVWVLPDSYGQVIYPRLAAHDTERGRTFEAVRAIRFVLLPVLIGVALLGLLGPFLVVGVFGPAYATAADLVRLLLPGIVAMSVSKILTRYFASRNLHQFNTYWIVMAVAVNAAANWILIPRLGVSGAAIAASVAWVSLLLGLGSSFWATAGMCRADWARFPVRDLTILRRAVSEAIRSRMTS